MQKSKYYGKYADKSDIPATHKYCPRCDAVHLRANFYRDVAVKDGLAGVCKTCQDARAKAWRKANPDRIAPFGHRRKEEDPHGWQEDRRIRAMKDRERYEERKKA